MKSTSTKWIALFAAALIATAARAADTYENSLKAGDSLRGQGQFEKAVEEYDAAADQAATDTERALAHGKQAIVLACDLKDYVAAKDAVNEGLKFQNVDAVAEVTVLQAQAECLIKGEKNYKSAATVLERALKLQGVDWARPGLSLSLGDAYRLSGQFEKAFATLDSIIASATIEPPLKAIAALNKGLTYQYGLKDFSAAKAAYAQAVQFNPELKSEIASHEQAIR